MNNPEVDEIKLPLPEKLIKDIDHGINLNLFLSLILGLLFLMLFADFITGSRFLPLSHKVTYCLLGLSGFFSGFFLLALLGGRSIQKNGLKNKETGFIVNADGLTFHRRLITSGSILKAQMDDKYMPTFFVPWEKITKISILPSHGKWTYLEGLRPGPEVKPKFPSDSKGYLIELGKVQDYEFLKDAIASFKTLKVGDLDLHASITRDYFDNEFPILHLMKKYCKAPFVVLDAKLIGL